MNKIWLVIMGATGMLILSLICNLIADYVYYKKRKKGTPKSSFRSQSRYYSKQLSALNSDTVLQTINDSNSIPTDSDGFHVCLRKIIDEIINDLDCRGWDANNINHFLIKTIDEKISDVPVLRYSRDKAYWYTAGAIITIFILKNVNR